MADKKPLYGDQALARVAEFGVGDTIPRDNAATGTLFDNAGGVPFIPRQGLISVDTQSVIEELAARGAGGRRVSYIPYTVERRMERIGRIHRVGTFVAGVYDGSEVEDTHGIEGHLYPFGAFAAYNERGAPHRDHDRLAVLGGPDLVTNAAVGGLTATKTGAGTGKFTRVDASTWGSDAYQPGKWIFPLGWSNAGNNGRFLVDTVDAVNGELVVFDYGDDIVTEAAHANHRVRGTTSGASGHNGFASGLLIMQGALDVEEAVHFVATGLIENDLDPDAFLEMVVEPNPPLDIVGTSQFTGANRMRMSTGPFGATWTGKKRVVWTYRLKMGHSNLGTEYGYNWTIDIEDVLSVGGSKNVTGGFNFKETAETMLCPRFRVDGPGNEDIYDAAFQATGDLQVEFQTLDGGMLH